MFTPSNISIRAPRMRLYLAQLAVCFVVFVGASRARADLEIYCTPNPNSVITCSIVNQGNLDFEIEDGVATCTNCVNMSPQKCEELKQNLLAVCSTNTQKLASLQLLIDAIVSNVDAISGYGTMAMPDPPTPIQNASENEFEQWWSELENQMWTDPLFSIPYTKNDAYISGAYNSTMAYTVMTAIYNYGKGFIFLEQKVEAPIFDLQTQAFDAQAKVPELQSLNNSLERNIVQNMSCEKCILNSKDGEGDDGVEGGSHGIYDDYLKQIISLLSGIQNHAKQIDENIKSIKKTFEDYAKQVKANFSYLTNFVHRLDDYVFPEFTNAVYIVQSNVVQIANSLSFDHFLAQSFSNATFNVDKEGDELLTEDKIKSVFEKDDKDESPFPFSTEEYFGIENWFTRIELLLLNIAGLTSTSNATEVTDEEMEEFDEQFKAVNANEAVVTNKVKSLTKTIEQVHDKYKQFLQAFNPLTYGIQPNYQIEFLPHMSFQDGDLVSSIDPIVLDLEYGNVAKVSDVVEVSRTIFNLIWMLTSLLFEISFFIFICKIVLGIVSWCMMYMRDFFR